MASRCCSIARPALAFLKSATKKPSMPFSANPLPRTPSFQRVPRELGSLQSLMPLHSAVASARLTSRLGIDSAGSSRPLSQGFIGGHLDEQLRAEIGELSDHCLPLAAKDGFGRRSNLILIRALRPSMKAITASAGFWDLLRHSRPLQ